MSDVEKIKEEKNLINEREDGEVGGNEPPEIEKLTDDCLIEIFQHLTTIADKIRIERVCKRWKNLSPRSWNHFKSLDFSAKTWGLKVDWYYPRLIRSIDFDKIIRLSGKYLTTISIDVGKFIKICHLLPKILRLHLIDDCLDHNKKCRSKYSSVLSSQRYIRETPKQCTYDPWQGILSWLISNGENITNFKMNFSHSHYKEDDFATILGKMKQLKSFSLYNCDYLDWSGSFLLELPFEIMQEIIFMSAYTQPFHINLLSQMIGKCKKLQTFGINIEKYEEPGILEFISLHTTSLKNLKLKLGHSWSRQWESALLSKMAVLNSLEKLDFSQCYGLNDEVLEVVAQNCKKLTYLNLLGCCEVTDRGISSICNLENLAYLNIGHMRKIRNPPLEKLTSLVVLVSFFNKDLQEECLCTFLKKAHQLRALNVRYFHSVSTKLLNVAIEAAKNRNANNELDLYVYETRIDMGVLDEKPPFLNLLDYGSNCVSLTKYGIEDPFCIENPEVKTY